MKSTRRKIVIGSAATAAGLAVAATAIAAKQVQANTQKPVAPQATTNPNGKFANKVILITGATSGIGEATARAFAKEGAIIHFCGRREALGNKVAQEIIAQGGRASYQRADMRSEQEVKAFVNTCVQKYGRIDTAFNNAGYEGKVVPFVEQTQENWDVVMNTNARGVFLSMLYEIPQMLKQDQGGVIINNASTSGHIGFPVIPAYVASKHAIIGLTKSAALAYPQQGIRVMSISPGFINTAQVDRFVGGNQARKAQIVQENIPVGRIGRVEEVARLVMWLSTNDSPFINGSDIVIDGGDLA